MARSKDRSRTARRWAERILEDESLTAELIDDAAGALLDWGIAQIEELARRTAGLPREEQDERFATLREKMKRAASEAGIATPGAQRERVLALLGEDELEDVHPEGQESLQKAR